LERTRPGDKGDEDFAFLAELRHYLDWRSCETILLGEANVKPDENRRYFGEHENGVHMMFNFYVNQRLFYALASEDAGPLAEALLATKDIPTTAQWAQFLRNHDELDLGRLTDEQRATVYEKFAPRADMRLYDRGIRRRLAPMLGDRKRDELAHSMLFSLPGTPVLRYGDEIGMGEDLSLKERDSVRTPMQWSSEEQAGFSTSGKLVHPVISEGPFGYKEVNVEKQRRDPGSWLNWMVRMIRLRKESPEIGWGAWELLETQAPGVLAVRYDWRGNSLVVIHNFSAEPRETRIRPNVDRGERLVDLIEEKGSQADRGGEHRIELEGYGYRWYRVGGLNHILRRRRGD